MIGDLHVPSTMLLYSVTKATKKRTLVLKAKLTYKKNEKLTGVNKMPLCILIRKRVISFTCIIMSIIILTGCKPNVVEPTTGNNADNNTEMASTSPSTIPEPKITMTSEPTATTSSDPTTGALLTKIEETYKVNNIEMDESKISLDIDASYSTIDELALSIRTLSRILYYNNSNWSSVNIKFNGLQVIFEREKWNNWLAYLNSDPEEVRTQLEQFADITITDINIYALSFNLIKRGIVTPLDGLKYLEYALGISAYNQNGLLFSKWHN